MADDLASTLAQIYGQNQTLARQQNNIAVRQAPVTAGDPRQLEYYPPWERDNPIPGKATVELYNTGESPEVTRNLLKGDMLHYLGSVDPRSGVAVDPAFRSLKDTFLKTITPQQSAVDRRAYTREAPMYGDNPPAFDDWMDFNRGDAYLRGYLTPDAADEWRKQGVYTPEQQKLLDKINIYLQRGSTVAGPR